MSYLKRWEDAKNKFETATNVKKPKPSGFFKEFFNSSGLTKALKEAEARGEIEYTATENVSNADYERVMREYATAGNQLILGEVFGVEAAARKVAKDFPKTAFLMGFLIFIPFVIIDLVVASVLMSMGMMMLSPVLISLPFKLMLFVLVDGWTLVMGTLASSFYS